MLTEPQARGLACPIARTFAGSPVATCRGSGCILWRWQPILASSPAFVSAVQAEMKRAAEAAGKPTGGGFHKQAVATVMADKAAHGVPDRSEYGWCGLGGKPEV